MFTKSLALILAGTLSTSAWADVPYSRPHEPSIKTPHTWVRMLKSRFQPQTDQLYELRRADLEDSIPETKEHIEYYRKRGNQPKLLQGLEQLLAAESAELAEIRVKQLLSSASRLPRNREEELTIMVEGIKSLGEEVPFFWVDELASLRCPTAPPPRPVIRK